MLIRGIQAVPIPVNVQHIKAWCCLLLLNSRRTNRASDTSDVVCATMKETSTAKSVSQNSDAEMDI